MVGRFSLREHRRIATPRNLSTVLRTICRARFVHTDGMDAFRFAVFLANGAASEALNGAAHHLPRAVCAY